VAERFTVKADRIIHESLGGEVVVIDLGSGTYYSMRGTAGAIWEAVVAGSTVGETAGRVASAYDTGGSDVRPSVLGFLELLEHHGLVARSEAGDRPAPTASAAGGAGLPPYEEPELGVFSDMQDLILLDPVHDVDPDEGWPHPIDPDRT
jgi:hypothetical protein